MQSSSVVTVDLGGEVGMTSELSSCKCDNNQTTCEVQEHGQDSFTSGGVGIWNGFGKLALAHPMDKLLDNCQLLFTLLLCIALGGQELGLHFLSLVESGVC